MGPSGWTYTFGGYGDAPRRDMGSAMRSDEAAWKRSTVSWPRRT